MEKKYNPKIKQSKTNDESIVNDMDNEPKKRGRRPKLTKTNNLKVFDIHQEIMDDHVADMLSRGSGIGFATKMAEQLIQQANAGKLIGSSEIAVKPLNAPREGTVSAETLNALKRPDGFVGSAK